MHCPTRSETLASLLALLPRGRAWQTHEGGPEPYKDAPFDAQAFDPLVFDTEFRKGSILYRFWEGVAYVIHYVNQRLCALALEMFCATQTETNDQWLLEYGLPDPCDPFPDLCEKVSALGGQRCEYFNERIARLGWRAECFSRTTFCGSRAGCVRVGARGAFAGGTHSIALVVKVHTNDPDLQAIIDAQYKPPLAGRFRAGHRPSCSITNINPVRCLMDRIAPAHVDVQYVI